MKDDIRNIINFENITRVRGSIGVGTKIPAKNSIVKLVPLEYFEKGVKVLIDGKLFIAFIDGAIPIKEEIIALVKDDNPFSLTLNLSSQSLKNESFLVDQIVKKFELKSNVILRDTISKVVQEGLNIIKSKILLLADIVQNIKVDGLELSLLINLVWNNTYKSKSTIEELYDNLFEESFEDVCNNLFKALNCLLFAELPQYISQHIKNNLIYREDNVDTSVILNKIKPVFDLIVLLNEYNNTALNNAPNEISSFIKYGTKYIFQKSILKDYDYYPDFVIIKRNDEITLLHYSIKKIYNSNKQVSYKILFKHEELPFQLSGIIRNNFLIGNLDIDEEIVKDRTINSLEESLFNHWGFRSDFKLNDKTKNNFFVSKIDTSVNKLIS